MTPHGVEVPMECSNPIDLGTAKLRAHSTLLSQNHPRDLRDLVITVVKSGIALRADSRGKSSRYVRSAAERT
jgi:hypothetical protein